MHTIPTVCALNGISKSISKDYLRLKSVHFLKIF